MTRLKHDTLPRDRRTSASIMTSDALRCLEVNLSFAELRPLMFFTKKCATTTAMVQTLRKLIAQYRAAPEKLLLTKGVGKKTYLAIIKLSEAVAAQEIAKEFGVTNNLKGAIAIIRNCTRGISPELTKDFNNFDGLVNKFSTLVESHQLLLDKRKKLNEAQKQNSSRKGKKS